MTRKRIVKKEDPGTNLDPSKDEFVTRSISALDWVVERRRQFGVLLAAGLVIWIVIIVVGHVREKSVQQGSSMISEALEAAFAPITAADPDGISRPDVLAFESREERAQETLQRIEQLRTQSIPASVSALATLVQAGALMEQEKYDEAMALYRESLSVSGLTFMHDSIRLSLGRALEKQGNPEAAQREYETVAANKGRMGQWARYELARVRHQRGESPEEVEKTISSLLDALVEQGDPDAGDYLLVQARALMLRVNPEATVPEIPAGINPMVLQQLLQMQQGMGGDRP